MYEYFLDLIQENCLPVLIPVYFYTSAKLLQKIFKIDFTISTKKLYLQRNSIFLIALQQCHYYFLAINFLIGQI